MNTPLYQSLDYVLTSSFCRPNFVIALIRPSRFLPPNYASFMVPLWLNKLDLKDYLYHLYGLQCLSVRSYVIQQKIAEKRPYSRRWYRPRSRKKMTVELVNDGTPGQGNFVWPKLPIDKTAWGKKTLEERIQQVKEGWKDREARTKKWAKEIGKVRKEAAALMRARRNGETIEEEEDEEDETTDDEVERQKEEQKAADKNRLSGSILQ